MNSTVKPIFNIFKCVNSDFCLCTVNSCDFTVHVLEKKKKKKPKNAETETRSPNGYLIDTL